MTARWFSGGRDASKPTASVHNTLGHWAAEVSTGQDGPWLQFDGVADLDAWIAAMCEAKAMLGEALARMDALAGELEPLPALPLRDPGIALSAIEGACCGLHGRNCEPPGELCCEHCTEQRHFDWTDARGVRRTGHPRGEVCSNPDLSGTQLRPLDVAAGVDPDAIPANRIGTAGAASAPGDGGLAGRPAPDVSRPGMEAHTGPGHPDWQPTWLHVDCAEERHGPHELDLGCTCDCHEQAETGACQRCGRPAPDGNDLCPACEDASGRDALAALRAAAADQAQAESTAGLIRAGAKPKDIAVLAGGGQEDGG